MSSRLNVAILSPVIEKSYRTLIWLNHCENIGAGNMYSFLVRNSNPFMFYIANGYMLVIHILKNVSYISYCTTLNQFSLLLYVYDTFILLVNVKKMLSFLYQVCYTIFMVDTILGRGALNINRVVIQTAEFKVIYVST